MRDPKQEEHTQESVTHAKESTENDIDSPTIPAGEGSNQDDPECDSSGSCTYQDVGGEWILQYPTDCGPFHACAEPPNAPDYDGQIVTTCCEEDSYEEM